MAILGQIQDGTGNSGLRWLGVKSRYLGGIRIDVGLSWGKRRPLDKLELRDFNGRLLDYGAGQQAAEGLGAGFEG